MEYEKICDEILKSDGKIRYAGVYDYGKLYDRMREGLESNLSKEETEVSLSQAVYRWSTRKKTAEKIGNAVFALAKYEKMYRVTVPIGGAGLILASVELDADIIGIADKILAIRDRHS